MSAVDVKRISFQTTPSSSIWKAGPDAAGLASHIVQEIGLRVKWLSSTTFWKLSLFQGTIFVFFLRIPYIVHVQQRRKTCKLWGKFDDYFFFGLGLSDTLWIFSSTFAKIFEMKPFILLFSQYFYSFLTSNEIWFQLFFSAFNAHFPNAILPTIAWALRCHQQMRRYLIVLLGF